MYYLFSELLNTSGPIVHLAQTRCASGTGVIAIDNLAQMSFLPQVYDSKSTYGSVCQGAGGLRIKAEWRRILARLLSYTWGIEVKCARSLDQPKPGLNGGTDVK